MAIVKSKYDGYGQIDFTETGHDSDFIATIANHTDKTLKVYIDDLEGWYSEPVTVPSNDWVGFLADEFGCFQAESIKMEILKPFTFRVNPARTQERGEKWRNTQLHFHADIQN